MIRFGGNTASGQRLVGLALGEENLKKLADGKPIVVDGATVGADGVAIVIVYGDTDLEAMERLVNEAREAGAGVVTLEDELLKMRRQLN